MDGVRQATPAECVTIARDYIAQAVAELDKIETTHATEHVRAYLHSARIWLPVSVFECRNPKPTARPPHPNTMAGK